MKRLIIGLFILSSCSKDDSIVPQTIQPVPEVKVTETYSKINQTTGWYQTNKLFAGTFFIDTSSVRNLYVNGDGSYNLAAWQANGSSHFSNRTNLFYGDFNGDGKNDLLNNYWAAPFGTNKPGYYVTWEYDKKGFASPNVHKGLTGARKFIFNDYFNTGRPQVLIASAGNDKEPFPGDSIQIASFNNDLSLNIKSFSDVIGYYHTAASGDIDNDGDIDILLYSGGGQSKMGPVYYENTGGGDYRYNSNLITGLNYMNNNPNNYYTMELFDVNGDGYLDIILGGSQSVDTRILWGSNSHTFNTNNQTILPYNKNYSSIMDIAFSDIDNDNDTDLILLYEISYKGFGIQILENKNNQYVDATDVRMDIPNRTNTLWFAWLRLFDIDKDGDKDLIGDGYGYMNNQTVPKIYWINDGKGNYKGSFTY